MTTNAHFLQNFTEEKLKFGHICFIPTFNDMLICSVIIYENVMQYRCSNMDSLIMKLVHSSHVVCMCVCVCTVCVYLLLCMHE